MSNIFQLISIIFYLSFLYTFFLVFILDKPILYKKKIHYTYPTIISGLINHNLSIFNIYNFKIWFSLFFYCPYHSQEKHIFLNNVYLH